MDFYVPDCTLYTIQYASASWVRVESIGADVGWWRPCYCYRTRVFESRCKFAPTLSFTTQCRYARSGDDVLPLRCAIKQYLDVIAVRQYEIRLVSFHHQDSSWLIHARQVPKVTILTKRKGRIRASLQHTSRWHHDWRHSSYRFPKLCAVGRKECSR